MLIVSSEAVNNDVSMKTKQIFSKNDHWKNVHAYRKTKKALGARLGLLGSFLAFLSFLASLFLALSSLETSCFFFFRFLKKKPYRKM